MNWKKVSSSCNVRSEMELICYITLFVIIYLLWDWYSSKAFYECSKIIPGPKLWPFFGNSLELAGLKTEEFFQKLAELSSKHGRFFRLWGMRKFYVLLNDPKDIELLLIDNGNLTKSDLYKFLVPWIGDGLLTATSTKWKNHRKAITPAFHFTSLDSFFKVFNKNSQILVECLQSELDKEPFNVFAYVNRAALDNICEAAMGVEYNIQKTLNSQYLKSVKTICRSATHRIYDARLWPDFIFNRTALGKAQQEAIQYIDKSTIELIKKRRMVLEAGSEETTLSDEFSKPNFTFLDMLLQSRGVEFSDEDIRDEINTFMFEGHDTVSSGTSFALYQLANHPEIQEKVYQEITTVIGDEALTMAKMGQLPYLQKVIKETLRIFPPSATIGRELQKDLKLSDGIIIPKGTNLLINIFGVHRNPKVWQNPDNFDPENFSKDTTPFSFIPFSAGPRNCIGQKFALLEMKTIICNILRNYRLLPSTNPKHDLILTNELVIISKVGQHIRIEKRKP